MKAKMKKNRITMIMLREADNPIRRSRFSRTSLYTMLCFICFVIVAITGWQYALHKHSANTIESLSEQISEHDSVYDQMVSEKETVIEDLKLDIIQLTEKTAMLKSQYEDLEQLKDEVLELLDEAEEAGSVALKPNESIISVLSDHHPAMGGKKYTPSEQQWNQFMTDSYSAIHQLEHGISSVSEQLEMAKSGLEQLIQQLNTTPNYWPTDSSIITSSYGVRSDPFTKTAAFHSGIDIAGNMHDPVYAAADGMITAAGWDAAKGYYVIIRHRSNLETKYMHLSKIHVSKNDAVSKGERIATIGSSGRSTGPHLHFEIVVSGSEVNPLKYFNN